jgi:hypothetical protein
VAFFGSVVIGGARRALRAETALRLHLATAVAAVTGFCASAAFDWVWQIGVIPMIAMLLAGVTFPADRGPRTGPGDSPSSGASDSAPTRALPSTQAFAFIREPTQAFASTRAFARAARATRVLLAVGALAAIWGIAIPLASTIAVRASRAAVTERRFSAALSDAVTAQRLEPGAASPRLQQALVLEQLDDVPDAARAIAAAITRERTNAELWLVAARIAVEAGQPRTALADYRRAKQLDPSSTIFEG